uniref:Uncharacterized protein n=1 Tax=Arundo donax TaxID=35708 RepID=A0A0A8YV31_ARUDO
MLKPHFRVWNKHRYIPCSLVSCILSCGDAVILSRQQGCSYLAGLVSTNSICCLPLSSCHIGEGLAN